jgi:Zn-finger nucleic acid-binding protein
MDECPQCHGVWLDCGSVERVIEASERPSVAQALGVGVPSTPVQAGGTGRMYLKCPECDTVMNRVNFGRRSGIILDNCRGHGTWFDHRELPGIVEFVRKGGLAESRARAASERLSQERKAVSIPQSSVLTEDSSSTSILSGVLSAVCWLLGDN